MNPQSIATLAGSSGAVCSLHTDRAAVAACARCGSFICGEDVRKVGAGTFCPSCAARPEVNYLEAFRLKHWGKRDSWAWLVGVNSLLNLVVAAGLVVNSLPIPALFQLAISAHCVCYFLGLRWARPALFAVPLMSVAGAAATLIGRAEASANMFAELVPIAIGQNIVPLLVITMIFFDTRNRLFFRVGVSEKRLKKAWDLYANNTMARKGFLLSFLGLLVPGVALIALLLSIVGLRRVDPNGHPPVGRKGQAIAGIVLSCVGLVVTGFFVFSFYRG